MSDRLYVVRLANGGRITTTSEASARESFAREEGATLSYRPFPSTVKTPRIGKEDYAFADDGDTDAATHLPTGVTGYGTDRREAYKAMLRAITDRLERETETVIAGNESV